MQQSENSPEGGTKSREPIENATERPKTDEENGTQEISNPQYLSGLRLASVMVGLMLSVFCLGLVRHSHFPLFPIEFRTDKKHPGPFDSRYRNTQNHDRVRVPQRHCVVRFSVLDLNMLLPAHVWQTLRYVSSQNYLPLRPRLIRSWLYILCCGAKLRYTYHWESDCRYRVRGRPLRGSRHYNGQPAST